MENEALSDARFCIRSENDEIYLVAFTNEEGVATINFENPPAEQMLLNWMVYHRNGIPLEGEILVIEGQGVVFGRVTDFATDEPLANADVELTRFGLDEVTDNDGNFRFERAPAGEDHVLVNSEGYISQIADIIIGEGEIEVDFAMRFSHVETDRDEIATGTTFPEAPEDETISITNTGNGDLVWEAHIDFGAGQERFGLTNEYNPLQVFNDTWLNGVVCLNDRIYIAGGNNNREPNFLYSFSSEFDSLGIIQQPDVCTGIGLRDLALFGEFIYGSSDNRIRKMTINEGRLEIVQTINGPYNPNRAIAVDEDENIYVCDNRMPIVKLDLNGDVLQTIEHNLNIRALAWSSFEEDGHNLFAFVQGDGREPVRLYAIDPEVISVRYVADLTVEDDEFAANSLTITNELVPAQTSIAGIVNHGADRYRRVWNLRNVTNWVDVEPVEGFLEPDESEELVLTFDMEGLPNRDLAISSTLILDCNSNNPHTEIFVSLQIWPNEVSFEPDATIPTDFIAVYPNPFNSTTTINFYQPTRSDIQVSIIDITGREIARLQDGIVERGYHSSNWNASEVSTGVYFCRVSGGGGIRIAKVVLVK